MAHCGTQITTLAAAEAIRDSLITQLCDAEAVVLTAAIELEVCQMEHGP